MVDKRNCRICSKGKCHRWWNKEINFHQIEICNPLKYKKLFRVRYSIRCKECGNVLQYGLGSSLAGVIRMFIKKHKV